MKYLPLKLGIVVVLLFAAVITTCLLWKPVLTSHYASILGSGQTKKYKTATKWLLQHGEPALVISSTTDIFRQGNLKRQVALIDLLIAYGNEGQAILCDTFPDGPDAAKDLVNHWSEIDSEFSLDMQTEITAALYIEYQCRVTMRKSNGCTLMHLAAVKNYTATLSILIEKGADVDRNADIEYTYQPKGYKGSIVETYGTPLHFASRKGNVEAVKILLDAGADVSNNKNRLEVTPLHEAARSENIETAKLLLKYGADVNALDISEWTPACWAGSKEMLDFIKANGGVKRKRKLKSERSSK